MVAVTSTPFGGICGSHLRPQVYMNLFLVCCMPQALHADAFKRVRLPQHVKQSKVYCEPICNSQLHMGLCIGDSPVQSIQPLGRPLSALLTNATDGLP